MRPSSSVCRGSPRCTSQEHQTASLWAEAGIDKGMAVTDGMGWKLGYPEPFSILSLRIKRQPLMY